MMEDRAKRNIKIINDQASCNREREVKSETERERGAARQRHG